jgi:hypothetical protein
MTTLTNLNLLNWKKRNLISKKITPEDSFISVPHLVHSRPMDFSVPLCSTKPTLSPFIESFTPMIHTISSLSSTKRPTTKKALPKCVTIS